MIPLFIVVQAKKKSHIYVDVCMFDFSDEEDKSLSSEDTRESVVKDLSKALLQVAIGVEPKYMGPPLGKYMYICKYTDSKQKV